MPGESTNRGYLVPELGTPRLIRVDYAGTLRDNLGPGGAAEPTTAPPDDAEAGG